MANNLALTQKHRRSSIQNLCLQLDTADKKSDSEQKFSECEEQQYSLMVLQPRALSSHAQTYIFHFFRIRHGVDRTSGYGRKRGRVNMREEAVSKRMLMTPVTWPLTKHRLNFSQASRLQCSLFLSSWPWISFLLLFKSICDLQYFMQNGLQIRGFWGRVLGRKWDSLRGTGSEINL